MRTAFFRLKKVGRRDGQKAESCPEGTLRRGHERRNSLNYNFLNGGGVKGQIHDRAMQKSLCPKSTKPVWLYLLCVRILT